MGIYWAGVLNGVSSCIPMRVSSEFGFFSPVCKIPIVFPQMCMPALKAFLLRTHNFPGTSPCNVATVSARRVAKKKNPKP